ncbi:MAG: NAD(P)H-binding protein [Acidobacteriota bacterium]
MTKILLTGATGFVGSRLHPLLQRRGFEVRCLTRDIDKARRRFPDWEWVEADMADRASVGRALEGCGAAYYLVHEMGTPGDFREREANTATIFAEESAAAHLERIIYLGGVHATEGAPSEHLLSRARVGQILSGGPVPAIELRASMIVGNGSLSFLIVRDLAARLPFMILPRWLDSKTEPVAIDDVLVALERALDIELTRSQAFDIPGPEVLSGREILLRTAKALGLKPPLVVRVPVLTPGLSSHWVRFVTRAQWAVAREIVVGLTSDLLAEDDRYWTLIGHRERLDYDEAARRAIAEEARMPSGPWKGAEGLMKRYRGGGGRA